MRFGQSLLVDYFPGSLSEALYKNLVKVSESIDSVLLCSIAPHIKESAEGLAMHFDTVLSGKFSKELLRKSCMDKAFKSYLNRGIVSSDGNREVERIGTDLIIGVF